MTRAKNGSGSGPTRLAWLTVVFGLALCGQVAFAQLTQQKLADIVKQAIAEKSVTFDPPSVSEDDGFLSYSAGGMIYPMGPRFMQIPKTSMDFPVDVQVKVELIRKYRTEKTERAAFEPYLARMEKLVQEDLALIAEHKGSKEELIRQLLDQEKKAKQVLAEAIAAWAKQRGLKLDKPDFPTVLQATVTLQTVPEGGTVYYLSVLHYDAQRARGSLDKVENWNQITQPHVSMSGNFYFRATWPGGKSTQTGKVTILNDQNLVLRAE